MAIKAYGDLNILDNIPDISQYQILIIKSKDRQSADGELISLENFIEDIINSERFNKILQDKLPSKRINTILRELIESEELKTLLKNMIAEGGKENG